MHKYEEYPEDTLGHKIRKLRYLKGLTVKELGKLCGREECTITSYESSVIFPHYTVMKKICTALGIPVQEFGDEYYTFVLSEDYESYLRQWRKENTKRFDEMESILGVCYGVYRSWEKGLRMTRESFDKIREKLI